MRLANLRDVGPARNAEEAEEEILSYGGQANGLLILWPMSDRQVPPRSLQLETLCITAFT